MITEHDLQEAIAECQGQRNPNANTCIKLAAFLTLQKEMFGKNDPVAEKPSPGYSFAQAPEVNADIGNYGDTDFLQAIEGKDIEKVFLIIDELMDAVQMLQPRIYDSIMRKIQNT